MGSGEILSACVLLFRFRLAFKVQRTCVRVFVMAKNEGSIQYTTGVTAVLTEEAWLLFGTRITDDLFPDEELQLGSRSRLFCPSVIFTKPV